MCCVVVVAIAALWPRRRRKMLWRVSGSIGVQIIFLVVGDMDTCYGVWADIDADYRSLGSSSHRATFSQLSSAYTQRQHRGTPLPRFVASGHPPCTFHIRTSSTEHPSRLSIIAPSMCISFQILSLSYSGVSDTVSLRMSVLPSAHPVIHVLLARQT